MPGISDSPPSRPKRLVPTNLMPRYFSSPSASTTRCMIMRRPSSVKSVRFSMCSMRSWIHAFWSGSEMCMYSTPILPQ